MTSKRLDGYEVPRENIPPSRKAWYPGREVVARIRHHRRRIATTDDLVALCRVESLWIEGANYAHRDTESERTNRSSCRASSTCPRMGRHRGRERALLGSRLDWTTLRPPRLSNRRGNGAYRTSTAGPVAGSGSIYRTDLADASIDVIDKTETLCKTIWVAS